MTKSNNGMVPIVIFDEYRSIYHKFAFLNFWSPPFTKALRRNPVLHPILNDESNSDIEKVNKMKEIVSSMKSTEELMELLGDKDRDGCTPLHVAAYHDSEKCCEFLIRWGANIEEGNNLLYSPLFYATVGDGLKSARVLLRHGANPKARAYMDQRKSCSWICFHYAQFMKRVDMLMLIFNFHTDIIACTLNVGDEKYNPLLFDLDSAVMKPCLLMYRKYCYDSQIRQTRCATCKLPKPKADSIRYHCGNCFSVTYCSRVCQSKDTQHIGKCNDEGFDVSNDNILPQRKYNARIRHLVLDFYGREPFPAFVIMTRPSLSLIFIGFGRIVLEYAPPFLEKYIKEVEQQRDSPEKALIKTIIPVWVIMYTTSRKEMKMFFRKLPDSTDGYKSMDNSLFVYALQCAM